MTVDEHFKDHAEARHLFDALRGALDAIGDYEIRVGKSQVAFRRRFGFAYAWMPERYLGRRAAPLVLSVGLRRKDDSPRWKEVVEAAPKRFTHHLELRSIEAIDAEVVAWLREAWEQAT